MNKLIYIVVKKILLFVERYFLWPLAYLYGPALIKELTPYDVVNFFKKIRIGSIHDGGYVLPLNILSLVERAYSYGIGSNNDFERDIQKRTNAPVLMYDHTVENVPPHDENMFFKKEGIAERKYSTFNTFENHIKENGDLNKKILLKIDIEGNEWKVIDGIINFAGPYIVTIILEIHGLYRYEMIPYYIGKLRTINKVFTLVHIHGNNNPGIVDSSISNYGKIKIPSTLELTFINNDLVKNRKVMTHSLPSKHDSPNISQKEDLKLDFWQ